VEVETSEILDAGWLVSMVELVDEEFFEVVMLLGEEVLLVVVEVEGDSSEPSDAGWLVSTIKLVFVEEFVEIVMLVVMGSVV